MKEHTWEVEEVDGGHVGVDNFWICHACGASGGPVAWACSRTLPYWLFLAGTGLTLSIDCDESKKMIEHYRNLSPEEKLQLNTDKGELQND